VLGNLAKDLPRRQKDMNHPLLPNLFWLFTKNEISHFVRNDKPVVVDKGKRKGGKAAFLFSLP